MIPKIFHFIYFTPQHAPDKLFPVSYYLAVASAIGVNQPQEVIFHFNREPIGPWWDKTKPLLTLHQLKAPETFMGRKLVHPAHQADVVRLLSLKESGGIYMDFDTICAKPLFQFLDHPFVMGLELKVPYTPKNWRQQVKHSIRKKLGMIKTSGNEPILCNGVLLSQKNSEFINLWLNEYKSFRSQGRDKYWNEHSSYVPAAIAASHPNLINIAGPYAFHYPLPSKQGMQSMFEEVTDFPDSFIHHLWESYSWEPYLSKLTAESIRQHHSTYNLLARKYI
jgi:Glycosyltransferase sugar-binding region containing DXD motif